MEAARCSGGAVGDIAQVTLPDGQVIFARVAGSGEPRDIAFDRTRALLLDDLQHTVRAVVDNLHLALQRHAPDETSVEFGLELAVRSGKVLSVLAEAGATASIKIQLSWRQRSSVDAAGLAARPGSGGAAPLDTSQPRPR